MVRRPPQQTPSQNISPEEQALTTTPQWSLPQFARELAAAQEAQAYRQEMNQLHREIGEIRTKLDAVCKQSDSQGATADELKAHRTTVRTAVAIIIGLATVITGFFAYWIGPEISILRDHAHQLESLRKDSQDNKLTAEDNVIVNQVK